MGAETLVEPCQRLCERRRQPRHPGPRGAAFLARAGKKAATILWAIFAAYSLLWFYVTQVPRYLAPVHAIGVLMSALAIYDIGALAARRFAPRTSRPAPRSHPEWQFFGRKSGAASPALAPSSSKGRSPPRYAPRDDEGWLVDESSGRAVWSAIAGAL